MPLRLIIHHSSFTAQSTSQSSFTHIHSYHTTTYFTPVTSHFSSCSTHHLLSNYGCNLQTSHPHLHFYKLARNCSSTTIQTLPTYIAPPPCRKKQLHSITKNPINKFTSSQLCHSASTCPPICCFSAKLSSNTLSNCYKFHLLSSHWPFPWPLSNSVANPHKTTNTSPLPSTIQQPLLHCCSSNSHYIQLNFFHSYKYCLNIKPSPTPLSTHY